MHFLRNIRSKLSKYFSLKRLISEMSIHDIFSTISSTVFRWRNLNNNDNDNTDNNVYCSKILLRCSFMIILIFILSLFQMFPWVILKRKADSHHRYHHRRPPPHQGLRLQEQALVLELKGFTSLPLLERSSIWAK